MVVEQDKSEVSKLIHSDKIHASEWYSNKPWLRASIAAISPIGTFIDVYLATKGQKFATERIIKAIEFLNYEVQDLIHNVLFKSYLDSEEFFDLIVSFFEKSIRTRQEKKVRFYVTIIKNAILLSNKPSDAYSPEDLLLIISELNLHEIYVLIDFIKLEHNIEELKTNKDFSSKTTAMLINESADFKMSEELINVALKRLEAKGIVSENGGAFGAFLGYEQISGTYSRTVLLDQFMKFLKTTESSDQNQPSEEEI